MPPSPSLQRPPARETGHKKGHSFESALPAKRKDDELMLFADMHKHEMDNFLLEPSEYFDESISKSRYFLDIKLDVNVPPQGQSHEMLNMDGDKNDYDWLLTPPETPLFRSLDDEEDQPIGQAPRGRAHSKPISISRSSTMENTRRSSRSSASPSRLSPSPCSSSSAAPSRTSASRCSPPLVLQPSIPSRMPSTPPVAKQLIPTRRSPSPASSRISTGSGGSALYGTRGTPLVKSNRGSSSSPKLRGWQSNIPLFSSDAPPNLRTSLPDRPVSRSWGTSPTSFRGLDTTSHGRRQSMSPSPSRRSSSSHCNERDRCSSYSKASATSSREDDADSMLSVPIGYSRKSAVKKNLAVMKTRTIASSKKPSKNFSPSSAPKRSFDSALWLMDHRKVPQNMFRPLLSSVPATAFDVGKGNNVHKPMFSCNSSLTTSSDASSERGPTIGPYMGTNHEQHNLIGEWEALDGSDVHDDIFMFDKLDELNEDPDHEHCASTTQTGPEISESTVSRAKYAESNRHGFDKKKTSTANQTSHDAANGSYIGYGEMATCPRCGKLFNVIEVDGGRDLCEECNIMDREFSAETKVHTLGEAHQQDVKTAGSKPCLALEPLAAPVCIKGSREASLELQLRNNEPPADCVQRGPSQLTVNMTKEILMGQKVKNHAENTVSPNITNSVQATYSDILFPRSTISECQQSEPTSMMEHDLFRHQTDNSKNGMSQNLLESNCRGNALVSETRTTDQPHQLGSIARPGIKVENNEATGISVLLLQKSGSNRWPVVEGRAMATTNIICTEPYYTRENVNIMKCSIGRDGSSASSSIDLGSSRQADGCFQCLMSGRRGDFEKAQLISTISVRSTASMSDMSISGSSVSLCPQSNANDDSYYPNDSLETSASKMMTSTQEHDGCCRDALSYAMQWSSVDQTIDNDDSPVDLNTSSLDKIGELAGDKVVIQNHNMGKIAKEDNSSTHLCSSDTEVLCNIPQSSAAEEDCMLKTKHDASGVTQCSFNSTPEHPSYVNNFENLLMQSEVVLVSDEADRLDNCCMSAISEEDVLVSATKANRTDLPNDEESSATVEESHKHVQRNFTLEEATDTILFCSSIIHDLAYKAATVGIECELEPELAKASRPIVTIVGKSIPKEDGLSKLPHKHTPNRKVKRKRLESEIIMESAEAQEGAKGPMPVRSASEITRTLDCMKPPKLESKCNCTVM